MKKVKLPLHECSSSIHFLNGGSYLSLISHLHTHCGDLPIKKFGYYIQAEDLQIYSFIYFLSFTCIKLKCLCNSTRKFHSYLKLKLSKTQFVICLPHLNSSSYSCILTNSLKSKRKPKFPFPSISHNQTSKTWKSIHWTLNLLISPLSLLLRLPSFIMAWPLYTYLLFFFFFF